MVYFAEFKDVE